MTEELNIAQIIPTIQGEGINSGVPTLLIRFSGCNIECPFCDTKWANDKSVCRNVNKDNFEQLIQEIEQFKLQNVMFTGGEPLLYVDNPLFIKLLKFCLNKFRIVEIETNGTLIHKLSSVQWYNWGYKLQFNISPKLNSKWYSDLNDFELLKQNCQKIVKQNLPNYWLKFVDNGKSGGRLAIKQFIEDVNPPINRVCLMPLTPPRPKIGDSYLEYLGQYRINCHHTLKYCMENGYRFIPRIHVFIFDDECEQL